MEYSEFFSEQSKEQKYIQNFHDGFHVSGVYLVKTKNAAVTKNGKEYLNLTLQDKTGTIDAKVWDPNSPGINEFEVMDYIRIEGGVTVFNGANQVSIQRLTVAEPGSYDPKDFFPVSHRDQAEMQAELKKMIESVQNPHLHELLKRIFLDDQKFLEEFSVHSAAKSVHHGFLGGLMEHTLSVAEICDYMSRHYPDVNRDLVVSAALLHDIGKVRELTPFPRNDYSDEGQLIGHIIIGYQIVTNTAAAIDGFPAKLSSEIGHCILSHHGELEYGSPKKPALMEAMVLSAADNLDAKLETMREALKSGEKSGKAAENNGWIGFNRFLDSNVRRTGEN